MSMPSWATLAPGSWLADRRDSIIAKRSTRHVQIWRLSDLALLHTIALPPSPDGDHAAYPAEPRVLPDGSERSRRVCWLCATAVPREQVPRRVCRLRIDGLAWP